MKKEKENKPYHGQCQRMVVCDDCKEEFKYRDATTIRPFQHDVYGKVISCLICPKCNQEEIWDI
jgi:hypothetical protein